MSDRKVFTNSVVALPDHPGLMPSGLMVAPAAAVVSASQPLNVMFSLDPPAGAMENLEDIVARGETIPAEALGKYGGNPEQSKKLADWLTEQGFEVTDTANDHSAIYAKASPDLIERTLQVKMVPVVRDGVTYMSAQNAPSLPIDIGGPVHAILGLQPFRRAQKHFRRRVSRENNRAEFVDAVPTPNIANAPPYLVAEILKAYGGDQLAVTGKGQSIAILIDTVPAVQDLEAFWKANGLPSAQGRIKPINVGHTPLPAPEGEETLDVCWTGGIARDAEIRIYASGSLQWSALDKALDAIIADLPANPGLRQLSVSLGLGELYMTGLEGEITAQHQRFLKLAAAGVNVFVSTGDAGSNPDLQGHSPTGGLQAEYSSTDSAVVAVGGTTLNLNPDGSVASETGWSAGGGGRSTKFGRPAWQQAPGIAAGSDRLVPDVCAAADPNTGCFLVVNGHPQQYGGTSWSAPVWAGICALLNEARGKAGKPFLPFLNPLLYPLAGSPCFRDIVKGSNGAYAAAPGHDLVTGLGAPNIAALIQHLS